jgi:large subunit ribosomal protein L19
MKQKVPSFNVGDTVRVQTRIIEGDKERLQAFMGTVIAKKGQGLSETFTIYRNAYGSSMDRVFLLHSPRIADIEVIRPGKVRRAKLYYLRGRSGKKAKVKEQFVPTGKEEAAPEQEAPQA